MLLGAWILYTGLSIAAENRQLKLFMLIGNILVLVCYGVILQKYGHLEMYAHPALGFTDLSALRGLAAMQMGINTYFLSQRINVCSSKLISTVWESAAVLLFVTALMVFSQNAAGDLFSVFILAAVVLICARCKGYLDLLAGFKPLQIIYSTGLISISPIRF